MFPEKQAEIGGEAGEFNSEVYLEDGIPLQTAAELRGESPPSFSVSHTYFIFKEWDIPLDRSAASDVVYLVEVRLFKESLIRLEGLSGPLALTREPTAT